jgi:hypothetical protein
MTDKKKLTPERLMQAKAFLENGVISKDQFIEMTHGQSDYETNDDSQQLFKILDKINAVELHLLKLESLILKLDEKVSSQQQSP